MGTIFEKKGLYRDAKDHFLRALKLDKKLIQAKINIATLHQLEGHIDKANRIYIDLEEEYPENPEILYRKSGFAIQLENFQEGWRCYEYRWKVFPMDRTIWPIQEKTVGREKEGSK